MLPVIALTIVVVLVMAGAGLGLLEHRYTGLRVAGNVTDLILGAYLTLFGFRVVHKTVGQGQPSGSRIETWRGPCKVVGPLFVSSGLFGLVGLCEASASSAVPGAAPDPARR
jgi:hypothetical protein